MYDKKTATAAVKTVLSDANFTQTVATLNIMSFIPISLVLYSHRRDHCTTTLISV